MTSPVRPTAHFLCCLFPLSLMACSDIPGEISRDSAPFDGIDETALITAGGTEPFWSIAITPNENGYAAVYSTPELIDGVQFDASRFAGNNGLGFSGEVDGRTFNLALTPGDCSDGMSDRSFPYTATLLLGDVTLYGCAYTDIVPFSEGAEN